MVEKLQQCRQYSLLLVRAVPTSNASHENEYHPWRSRLVNVLRIVDKSDQLPTKQDGGLRVRKALSRAS